MKMVRAAEFKTHCLRILDEVNRTGEPVTITKRGRIVGVLNPPEREVRQRAPLFGSLKSAAYHFEDPFSPAYDGPWDAEKPEAWDEYL